MADALEQAVDAVLRNDNCTGCGGCSLLTSRITMRLDAAGYSRPIVRPAADAHERSAAAPVAHSFTRMCPGRSQSLTAAAGATLDPVLGPVAGMWRAWARDEELRRAGSSGGALTALSAWLVESGQADSVAAAGSDPSSPSRTVPVTIQTRQQALEAAGSRYAPVPALVGYRPGSRTALVAKPCEVSAALRLERDLGTPQADRPVRLSFFCAGVPSQSATDELMSKVGAVPSEVVSLRYRGNGWPGRFSVDDGSGTDRSLSYADSWGDVLGRRLQPRCKVCVDGTGGDADISVGDLWASDGDGYPDFSERDGESVVIARTARGLRLVAEAVRAGVLVVERVEASEVLAAQPLQVSRRSTMAGRLAGKAIALQVPPRFRGYGLLRPALRHPLVTARAAAGTFVRTARRPARGRRRLLRVRQR